MTSVLRDASVVGSYLIDGLDQRIQKNAGGSTATFDYDENSQLLSEATDASTRDYVWLGDIPVAAIDGDVGGRQASFRYIFSDHQGTPRAVTDAAGAVIWQWAFAGSPFGELPPVAPSGYVFNLRLAGQYFDAEAGLNYNVHRDYEPSTGRYIQSDPVGIQAGPSTYAYASNTPLMSSDALGLVEHKSGQEIDCEGREVW